MRIKSNMPFVTGTFNTKKGQLVCVKSDKYASVELCFKEKMNIPFAHIRLETSKTFMGAKEVYEDACKLGDEIVRRWNESTIKK